MIQFFHSHQMMTKMKRLTTIQPIENFTRVFFLLSFLLFFSCTQNQKQHTDSKDMVAARVNDAVIKQRDVDNRIEKRLYNILYQVYALRRQEINVMIDEQIISLEAEKHHLTSEMLLDSIINRKVNRENLDAFTRKYKFDVNGITSFNNTMEAISVDSHRGRQLLELKYKKELLELYTDSLRAYYEVAIDLQPPPTPRVLVDKFNARYRGKTNSPVTVFMVSDLECSMCREFKPTFDSVYQKYKDKVRFGFSYFSSDVTLSSLALECAGKQNRFWEMYDSIANRKKVITVDDAFAIASNCKLDMEKFYNDIQDTLLYNTLVDDYKKISGQGVYGTPTIMVDSRILPDWDSSESLETAIEHALSRKQ